MIAITGAYSYTGKYVTRLLLDKGHQVKTLTGHPDSPNEFGDKVPAFPLDFTKPDELTENLKGVDTLICTYWIRFAHGDMTYEKAVENTRTLLKAANDAGVGRFVYVSITCADPDSPLPYFNGKGRLELDIKSSGLSYGIIRPTVIYGPEDILINNIAFMLKKFPIFPIPGNGEYKLQPIWVEDMARIVLETTLSRENIFIDAVGPEIFTFNDMCNLIKEKTNASCWIIHLNQWVAQWLSAMVGIFFNDVILTKDEVLGLSANLLISENPPTGQMALSDWLEENARMVGSNYHSELSRHYK